MGYSSAFLLYLYVICVGDSITFGDGYFRYMKDDTGDIEYMSNARPGVRSSYVNDLLYSETMFDPGYDYIVWEAGINDCFLGDEFNHGFSEDVISDIFDAITLAQDIGSKIVLVQHHPWRAYRGGTKHWRCSEDVNLWMDNASIVHRDVLTVDTSFLGDEDGYLYERYDAGDGLHLSHAGNVALSEAIIKVITDDIGSVYTF